MYTLTYPDASVSHTIISLESHRRHPSLLVVGPPLEDPEAYKSEQDFGEPVGVTMSERDGYSPLQHRRTTALGNVSTEHITMGPRLMFVEFKLELDKQMWSASSQK